LEKVDHPGIFWILISTCYDLGHFQFQFPILFRTDRIWIGTRYASYQIPASV